MRVVRIFEQNSKMGPGTTGQDWERPVLSGPIWVLFQNTFSWLVRDICTNIYVLLRDMLK